MSRRFSKTGATDYLEYVTADGSFAFNTNVQLLALCRINGAEDDPTADFAWRFIVNCGLAGTRGYGLQAVGTNGLIGFNKTGQADVQSTSNTLVVADVWTALLASSGTGADADFKMLRLDTGALVTSTVSDSATLVVPVSGDSVWIGQHDGPVSGLGFPGDIFSVAILNSTLLTDDEFRHWVYTQQPARGTVGQWTCRGFDPETQTVNAAGYDMAVTGTSVQDNPPVRPWFGLDQIHVYAAAAAGGLAIPVACHHRQRNF